jgi:hypothetical protein
MAKGGGFTLLKMVLLNTLVFFSLVRRTPKTTLNKANPANAVISAPFSISSFPLPSRHSRVGGNPNQKQRIQKTIFSKVKPTNAVIPA